MARRLPLLILALFFLGLWSGCSTTVELESDPSEVPRVLTSDHPEIIATRGYLVFPSLEILPISTSKLPAGPTIEGTVVGKTFLPPYQATALEGLERPRGATLVGGWLYLPTRRFHPFSDADRAVAPRVRGLWIAATRSFIPTGPLELVAVDETKEPEKKGSETAPDPAVRP